MMSEQESKRQRTIEKTMISSEKDAVSWLQRHADSMKWELPVYTEEDKTGESHCPVFTMRCTVGPMSVVEMGNSKKLAKQNVARSVMNRLKSQGLMPVETLLEKTAYQDMQELAQKQGWVIEFPWVQKSQSEFLCCVKIDSKIVSEELGSTRKEAKENASHRALQTLQTEPLQQPHALEIVRLALSQYADLTKHIKVTTSGCVACIVMESPETGFEVVAMGNGTSCYCDSLKPEDPNRELVLDGHAEVLARRSFLRFLYSQLELAQTDSRSASVSSIFQRDTQSKMFHLRAGIVFHLYVSVLPCGDAKMFNDSQYLRPLVGIHSCNGYGSVLPSREDLNGHWPCMGRKSEGLLRARLETGESYSPLPASDNPTVQRMRKITCSDKILSWNVLGLQGALLSSFIHPIYFASIIIGGKSFSHGAASRAFCCRARDVAHVLQFPFRLNHPDIFFVGDDEVAGQRTPAGHGGSKLPGNSWSWTVGDVLPEVLDCRKGRPVHALNSLLKVDKEQDKQQDKEQAEQQAEQQAQGEQQAEQQAEQGEHELDAALVVTKSLCEILDSVSLLNSCVQFNDWTEPLYQDETVYVRIPYHPPNQDDSIHTSNLEAGHIPSPPSPTLLSHTECPPLNIAPNIDDPESADASSSLKPRTTLSPDQVFKIRVSCDIHGTTIEALGIDQTKKSAKQAAAELFLLELHRKFGPILESPISRISGAALFTKYQQLLKNTSTNDQVTEETSHQIISRSGVLTSLTYQEAKARASKYQAAKITLHSFFASPRDPHGQGGMNQSWISRRH